MLRNGVDNGNSAKFDLSVNYYEQAFLHAQLEDHESDEDDAKTNLLLNLVVHYSNVQCLKQKRLLLLKAAELRR